MTNVEWYYSIVGKYRRGLDAINKKFDEQIEAKKRYAGSAGHTKDVEEIEKNRMAEITSLREDCGSSFDSCIASMQKAAQSRPITPPTQEQLNVIQLLKMKEHVSRDELEHAAHSMGDCSLALSILEEIARANEILGFHAGGVCVSDQFVNDAIRAFAKSARITLSMDRTNQRRELLQGTEGPYGTSPSFENISKFRLDIDPENAQKCAARWGGVPEEVFEAFSRAVSPSTKNT